MTLTMLIAGYAALSAWTLLITRELTAWFDRDRVDLDPGIIYLLAALLALAWAAAGYCYATARHLYGLEVLPW